MECSLAVLIACFSWSNFFVNGGLAYHDAGYYQELVGRESIYIERQGAYELSSMNDTRIIKAKTENPYGAISIGWDAEVARNLRMRIVLFSHESSVTGDDRGVNSASLNLTWFPFR